MYRWLLFWAIAVALSAPGSALPADKSFSCQAPADIQIQINKAGLRGIDDLFSANPGNFWIGLAYIDSKSSSPQLRGNGGIPSTPVADAAIEHFRKESESRPEDPEAAYLYAYSMIHINSTKSIEILTALTKSAPSFSRPWLTLAVIHSNSAFVDAVKVRQYTEKYLSACPNTLESRIATLAQQLDRSDTVMAYVRALREQVAGKEDEQTLSLYAGLWQLESKLARPAEKAEYRKHLESDLKFLEGLDKVKYRNAELLLTQGYQILDKGGSAGDMSSITAFFKAQSDWQMANAKPGVDAAPEERAAYYKKLLQFASEWRDKLPDNTSVMPVWFNAVSAQPDVADDFLILEGDKILASLNKSGIVSPSSLDVLRIWAFRGLELNRVATLAQEILSRQTPLIVSPMAQSDLYGNSSTLMTEDMRWRNNTRAWSVLVTTYVKSRQLDKLFFTKHKKQ